MTILKTLKIDYVLIYQAVVSFEEWNIRFNRNASPEAAFPSIDYAMESAARTYGENSLGVLLTGIGSDGVKGMKAIKDAGGSTIAEDEASCVVYGMPKAALESGCVDELVPLPRIAETILRML